MRVSDEDLDRLEALMKPITAAKHDCYFGRSCFACVELEDRFKKIGTAFALDGRNLINDLREARARIKQLERGK